jgi:hypothetical protein
MHKYRVYMKNGSYMAEIYITETSFEDFTVLDACPFSNPPSYDIYGVLVNANSPEEAIKKLTDIYLVDPCGTFLKHADKKENLN